MAVEPRAKLRLVRHSSGPRSEKSVTEGTARRLFQQGAAAQLSDEVVAAAKRGEVGAWEAVYAAYQAPLRGFLMVRLHTSDVDDALAETYLRAIAKIGSLRSDELRAFRAWMYAIAGNVANDRHRARQREAVLGDQVDEPDISLGDSADGLILSEQHAGLRKAFASLDPDDQQVVWLRVVADLGSDEVGQIVGKRPSAVRMQQMRALTELGRRLEELQER